MRAVLKILLTAVVTLGLVSQALAARATTVFNPVPDPTPSAQIIGGVDATEPYPYMASLQSLGGGHFCGAALIRPQWLYTAKHCVDDEGPGTFQARIGSHNRTSGGVVVRSAQVVLHPSSASDAALVRLANPVSYQPLEVASSTPIGSPIRLLGWGAVCDPNPCAPPTILQQLDTSILPDQSCGRNQWELCVNNPNGWRGACYGDSGGPALIKVAGVWQLAGGTHGGTSAVCGQGPSFYTDAAYHKSWVEGIVGGGGGGKQFESQADVQIPDSGTAESPLQVSGTSGAVPGTLEVDLNIVHTWRGDLKVELVAPNGTVYPVVAPSGNDGNDNITGSFTVSTPNNGNANGTWKLRVTDRAAQDVGHIDRWRLRWFS
ncbi:trypsin-like serine protease [Nonomuraea lactucae]|uniref:trypsin-like serine protease n=1 Tax=Nonomuraea lactucae TaxID=2249762 RepID=UPI000DE4BEC1|nr:trypsin-like serine protease [Nonomuraea lactucae]